MAQKLPKSFNIVTIVRFLPSIQGLPFPNRIGWANIVFGIIIKSDQTMILARGCWHKGQKVLVKNGSIYLFSVRYAFN